MYNHFISLLQFCSVVFNVKNVLGKIMTFRFEYNFTTKMHDPAAAVRCSSCTNIHGRMVQLFTQTLGGMVILFVREGLRKKVLWGMVLFSAGMPPPLNSSTAATTSQLLRYGSHIKNRAIKVTTSKKS